MFRHSLILGLLLAVSAPAWADFEGVLEERQHDFGIVPRGQQLTHYFRLVNNTDKTLTVSGVRVSCGCVSARALETVIAPGRETAVLAQMDSRRFVGSKQVTIYVTFSQPRFEELRTVVTAFAREDLVFTPDGINFGKVKQGDAKTASMNISFYNGSVKIVEAKSDSTYVQPIVKEVSRNGGQTVYQVEAKVRSDTPVGLWFTDVFVKTDNAGFAKLRVPVTVEVEGLQPAKTEPKKVDATKTSRISVPSDNDARDENTTEDYHVYPAPITYVVERPSIFPFFGYFRR